MLRKINNKLLLMIFAILAMIVGLVYWLDSRKGDRTFRSDLFSVDTTAVTAVKIFPKGKTTEPLILERNGKAWMVVVKQKKYPADSNVIRNLLTSMVNVTAERVSASGKDGWKPLEITDSLGRHVIVEAGSNTLADFVVGKASFSQGGRNPYQGGNQGFSVKSNVRVTGDDRVYIVDGFLSMIFTDQASMYRNKLICKFDRNQATKLTFLYPGDSSFQLTRNGNAWLINGKPADSAKAAGYFNTVCNTNGSEFADDGTIPVTFPYVLKIEGNNMPQVEISGAFDPVQKKYYIRSNANIQATFGGTDPSVFRRVFVSAKGF